MFFENDLVCCRMCGRFCIEKNFENIFMFFVICVDKYIKNVLFFLFSVWGLINLYFKEFVKNKFKFVLIIV